MNANGVESVVSNTGNAIITRILPGTDLTEGIEAICRANEVIAGCIVSGIGSLRQATFAYLFADPNSPSGAAYCTPQIIKGPLELMCLQGTIGLSGNNDISVHLHGMMIDSDARVCGGHLISSGNPVLITAEIMVYSTPDVPIVKTFDHQTAFERFILK